MVVDGLRRHVQALGDLCIGKPERQCFEDLLLAGSQIEGVLAARCERTAWDAANAQLREPAAQTGGSRFRLQAI